MQRHYALGRDIRTQTHTEDVCIREKVLGEEQGRHPQKGPHWLVCWLREKWGP